MMIDYFTSLPILRKGEENKRKERNEYNSPVDALVTIAKRLSVYETRHGTSSEAFFNKYEKGLMEDSVDFVEWSNDYRHYLAIRTEIEKHLRHVA
jgi:hypothetical protein